MLINKSKKTLKFFLFFPLLIYFGKRSLIAFDEGFYAMQARWIIENSNWIGPMWWDQVSSDRTIGIQFLIALSKKFFGNSIFVVYIPILIASISMIYFTYLLHKELIEDKYPIYSSLILSTTFLWINYAHMASQDMVFSSVVSLGILSSIKAYKTNKKVHIFFTGAWIGLAFMLKTYLTVIPLLGLIPFLIKSKLLYKRNFWLGTFVGFFPFLIWSYKYISIYSFSTYSGLFEKLIRLSKNNNFTNPFYYYLWNFTVNIFPWTIPSLIGFLKSYKSNNLSRYFLFYYPIFILILLSLFSTKTPYYPLQILSLVAINSYIGIGLFVKNNKNKIINIFEKINYLIIPLLVILLILVINFSELIDLNLRSKIFISLGAISFSFIWINFLCLKDKKTKIFSSILGPYILILFLVQSGLITDKSRELRVAIEELTQNKTTSDLPVQVVKSDASNDQSFSKIIKIMVMMPNIGKGINDLNELNRNSYAWTTKDFNPQSENKEYEIVSKNKIFYPWKLIFKK